MKRIILFAVMILLAVICSAQEKYYSINIREAEGNILFLNVNLLAGDMPDFSSQDSVTAFQLLASDSSVLFERTVQLNQNNINIIELPYYKEAITIKAIHNSSEVLNISVIGFADLCGDSICQKKENAIECPSDCRSGSEDGFCDGLNDGVCDPDCELEEDVDCKGSDLDDIWVPPDDEQLAATTTTTTQPEPPKEKASLIIPVIVIVSIIAIIILVLIMIKARSGNSQLEQFIHDSLDKGYSRSAIKNHLLSSGFSEQDINQAFKNT